MRKKEQLVSRFKPFLMERMMSKYEQKVDYNLSESGVHPIYLRELYKEHPDELAALLDSSLNYPHVNGLPELRSRIANPVSYTHLTLPTICSV